MNLLLLKSKYSISKLPPESSIPMNVFNSTFYSISKTDEELSLVCETHLVKYDCEIENDWKVIKVQGPLDFSLTGILASLTTPLAEAKISIFAISTFDTDYLMIKENSLEKAIDVLTLTGFKLKN